MNIWLVNHYSLSPESAGGTRHYDLAAKLCEMGHDVTIVAASFNHWTKKDEHCRKGEPFSQSKYGVVSFLWLKTPPYSGSIGRLLNMLVFSRRIRFELRSQPLPDVIIGSSPHLFAARAAFSLAKKLGVPFVLEIRDLWPQTLLDLGTISRWHPMVKIMQYQEKKLYAEASHIVALMPGVMLYLSKFGGVSEDKVKWIPNGVDLARVPCSVPANGDCLDIVYAGSHGIANGLDSVIKTISLLEREGLKHKFRFTFYGEGPEKKRLQQLAVDLDLQSLSFYPPIPKAEIYDVLLEADAFIVTLKDSPLYKYGISLNKLYDYMALARPVVFAGKSLNNPVAEANAGIVVPAEDSAAMASALKSLADMTAEERAEMGKKGRAFVAEGHDTKLLASRLALICQAAVSR